MKRKLTYNKVIIYNTHQLNELVKNSNLIDEVEISIPGIPIDLEKIPQSVSVLRFNYNFENLPCEIPPNIKSVYFYEFSELIEELPNTIEHIQIQNPDEDDTEWIIYDTYLNGYYIVPYVVNRNIYKNIEDFQNQLIFIFDHRKY